MVAGSPWEEKSNNYEKVKIRLPKIDISTTAKPPLHNPEQNYAGAPKATQKTLTLKIEEDKRN